MTAHRNKEHLCKVVKYGVCIESYEPFEKSFMYAFIEALLFINFN